ncbi:hypothetical protein HOU00_gp178 [Caulobacter phage CcrPW]|uniref:Uncharacterized protein n=1 Tax=Caulobacter phage CcrPW TaxID=2283271 RepID=A0A385EDQ0_9CAUD|nr:hypothetical protein HOU00_gp178 [Caulobacter phage CcrPW]AXQ68947.1 hypothetical protein CcrPW_gp408 [Caulobacter phage CcrPW]
MSITSEQQAHADEIAPLLEMFLCLGAMYMEMHQDRDGMLAVQPHLTSLAKETAYALAKSEGVREDRVVQLVKAISGVIRVDGDEEACRDAFEAMYRRRYMAYPASVQDNLLQRRPTGNYRQYETYRDYEFFKAGFEAAR